MKKMFLGALALMFLTVISCKEATDKAKDAADNVEEIADEAADKVEEAAEEVAEAVETATDGVPSFDNEEVQKYVNKYEEYVAAYKKAAESKDMTAFAALGKQGQDLANDAQAIAGKLSGEDAQKWTEYMTASSQKMAKYAEALTKQ